MKAFAEISDYDSNERIRALSPKKKVLKELINARKEENNEPPVLGKGESGVFFGYQESEKNGVRFVGMPEGSEGNIIAVGGNGSGKSYGIAKPTLKTWHGAVVATDIKGELSRYYAEMYQNGAADRPYIIFNPTQVDGPSYDPFWWLQADDKSNLIKNIWEIVCAIIPANPRDNQPFWIESERALLAAALLYFFNLGLSFSEAICKILTMTIVDLCKALVDCQDLQVRIFLGDMKDVKSETLASIERGLRNKLALFASDPYISHAFRGMREGATYFTWDDLRNANIFLYIPADRVEEWGGTINLMITQLFHYLERRSEQYTEDADHEPQMLLLLDEFSRFGKIEMMAAAMSTLRSKKVNIFLFVQSVAQIDNVYGEYERRIIFDNCQYQIILRSNDPDSQEYLCRLIGTRIHLRYSISGQWNQLAKTNTGFSNQISETRDWAVCPHELSTLDDVLLLLPQGFFRVKKAGPGGITFGCYKMPWQGPIKKGVTPFYRPVKEEDIKMLTIEERTRNANMKIEKASHQQRLEQKAARDRKKKEDNRRKFVLGSLVLQYFPKLNDIDIGKTTAEDIKNFGQVKTCLALLANEHELVHKLWERAGQRLAQEDQKAAENSDV